MYTVHVFSDKMFCWYYNTKEGCRNGDLCPYKHKKKELSQVPLCRNYRYVALCLTFHKKKCRLSEIQMCRLSEIQMCRLSEIQMCRSSEIQMCRLSEIQMCRLSEIQMCSPLIKNSSNFINLQPVILCNISKKNH